MSLTEKKEVLFQIVRDADEEMAARLIEYANQLKSSTGQFTKEELETFHATRQAYLTNPGNSFSLEDAHAYVRSLKKK